VTGLRGVARRLLPRPVRNWIRAPGLSAARLIDEARYLTGRRRVVELYPGWRVRCHPAALREAYHAHLDDPSQVDELDAFVRCATPGMVLFDLGAHYGAFSLAALHFGGPSARAVAVEPSPGAVRMLGRQARLNGVHQRLTVIRGAASATEGQADLVAAGVIAAGYYVPPAADHPASERTRVTTVTVDGLSDRLRLHPTHLKVDVEGAEAAVLEGAAATLRRDPQPLVFLELHAGLLRARGEDPGAVLSLLEAAGYTVAGWDGVPAPREAVLAHSLVRFVAFPPSQAARIARRPVRAHTDRPE
jgi:FkbM family methyltransferase